ncbi:hypothetical protein CRG98_007520 [Punica granatum]|uniref:PGG domain-containing protein n=1 Tax=Punica granatum TaxID=22663 RepID=A0A2I0KUP3_PUNGR|nr:hypothetical protein CRG98_007520 [Punica granatum]
MAVCSKRGHVTFVKILIYDHYLKIVKLLLTESRVELNAVNHHGFTALDTALAQGCGTGEDVKIQELLKGGGAVQATQIALSRRVGSIIVKSSDEPPEENSRRRRKKTRKKDWLEQKRAAIMVVASLIASIAFQAVLDPPIMNMQKGETIPKATFYFLLLNGASFNASIFVILLMISGLPWMGTLFMWLLMVLMWIALITILLAYRCAEHITLQPIGIRENHITTGYLWHISISILLIGHIVRLAQKIRRWIKRRKSDSSPSRDPDILI